MFKMIGLSLFLMPCLCAFAGTVKVLDATMSFQAVHRLGPTIWASGTHGGIFRSQDNGDTWQKVIGPANTQHLQFRDIQPHHDGSVSIMSAGEGEDSRVYRSDKALQHWQLQIKGERPETFFDCLYFSDDKVGWLYGDSDKHGLFVLATEDGGYHWQRQTLPMAAQAAEGGFASSGSCINQGDNEAIYIGTGNGNAPRVLALNNARWQSIDSPLPGGEAAGIFSVQQAQGQLFVFGGSLKFEHDAALAYQLNLSSNQWSALPKVPLNGAIYGSALFHANGHLHLLIANPQGVAVWWQGQKNWSVLSKNNIWSLSCDDEYACVGVGKDGLVEILSLAEMSN